MLHARTSCVQPPPLRAAAAGLPPPPSPPPRGLCRCSAEVYSSSMAGSSSAAAPSPPRVGGSPTCDCCCCCRPKRDGVCTWPLPGAPAWCPLLLLAPPAAPTGLSGWDGSCCTSTSSCWLLVRLTGLLLPLLLGSELRPEPALPGRSTLQADKNTNSTGRTCQHVQKAVQHSLQHAGAAFSWHNPTALADKLTC
jgi:hypothetical protein